MSSIEILQKTGLSVANYNYLMGLCGIICGFLLAWIFVNVILNVK